MAMAIVFAVAAIAQTKQSVNATQMSDPQFQGQAHYAPQILPAPSPQAITGYYENSFESTTFPPTGWNRFNISGTNQWVRSTNQFHTGTASAYMQYQSTAAEDWLVMPKFLVGATTDSMTFWMRLAFSGYPPDSLSIKVSTTDSLPSSFTATLLGLREGVNYPSNATMWYRYAVSLSAFMNQQVYVAFKHYNNNGDGLYIDDVTIGTRPAAEIMATSITMPSAVSTTPPIPQATFTNNGSAAQSFNVTLEITPGTYSSTSPVTSLAPMSSANVSFAAWTPQASGTYTLKVYSSLAGDANNLNDTLYKTVQVLSPTPNNNWSAQSALPAGRWATAPVFVKPCVASTDTGFVYLISGSDAAFAITPLNSRYNMTTGTWSTMAPIPSARMQMTPVAVQNKIYVIGGYTSGFTPTGTTSIYDITSNTWSTGASMPTAVGDYAVAVYGDSLIYIVAGYNGTGDVNTVQIYNVNTNTWSAGTVKPGAAVAGGRMGITGNSIVFAGGYNQTTLSQSAAYIGLIDPLNPGTITWSSISPYPGGTSSRLGAGTSFFNNGRVYFGGGDPNGQGTQALNTVFAYNTLTSEWESGPAMITGVSNISAFAGAIHNNTSYLITMCGYNGSAVTTSHEWLELNPVSVPYAQPDTAICIGSSFTIDAFNGMSYSWSPSTGLANTNTASTVATPTVTTTYTVSIERGFGCPVVEEVGVTVNALPVASAGTDAVICVGDNVTLTATGGDTYSWTPATGLSNDAISNPVASPASTTTYTVVLTNTATGCINSDDVIVAVNALPVAAAGSDAAICAGGNVTLSATGGDTYSWTPATGLSNDAISNPVASPASTTTYTVVLTNTATGCVNSDDVIVAVNALPVAAAGNDAPVCSGSTVNLLATGGDVYLWSPAAGLNDASIDAPVASPVNTTTYTVTVTSSATGCVNTDQVVVTVNDVPMISASTSDVLCFGGSNGSAMISVSGTGTYTYSWTSGGTASTENNLAAGSYTVIVTDAVTGCMNQGSVVISQPAMLTVSVPNDSVSGCTGVLTADVAGGTGPYTYLWNDTAAQVTNPAVNLCSGNYSVLTTDANGCTMNATGSVIFVTGMNVAKVKSITIYPNPTAGSVVIEGAFSSGQHVSIALLNMLGEQVMKIEDSALTSGYHKTVDLSSIADGVYYLQISEGNNIVSVSKIVKQ